MQHLKQNTLLQGGKYKIERILGQGGFGITYLATQELLDRKVCIKEFFFKEYCERDEATSHVSLGTQNSHEIVERFMNKFLKEAHTIFQLEHPNIIKIFDIFKENNTAYYVMEYIEGESLSDKVNHYGSLSESEAKDYINQVASALEYIHQRSINHLDVKPANIMVRKSDSKAILIDFGLSKQYDAQGGQTSTTPVGMSHGYAPMEQYKQGGVSTFSPQTDIYSLGATLYKLVTGNTPPQAMDILDEGLPQLPSHLSQSVVEVIKKSMQARKLDRYNNIEEFLRGLDDVSQKTSFTHQETKSQNIKVSDEETKIIDDSQVKTKEDVTKTVKTSLQGSVKISETEENGSKKGWIVMLVIAVILGIIGYNFVENKNEERARIEAYQLAQAQKQEAYNAMMTDKMEYIQLIGEGDILLNNKKYSESINKYKQAQVFEIKYSNTDYNSEFNERVDNKISAVYKAEQEYKIEQSVITNDKVVDLGLSVLWAGWNIGASSPESYGGLYRYGDPYNKITTWDDNACPNYDIVNTDKDIAKVHWGNGWRMPSMAELQELVDKCTIIEVKYKGVDGHKVVGPNGNCIFLPSAGTMYNYGRSQAGVYGCYASGELNKSDYREVRQLYVNDGKASELNFNKGCGSSVRAVKNR